LTKPSQASCWPPLLRKIGKAPEQFATIKFDVTMPN